MDALAAPRPQYSRMLRFGPAAAPDERVPVCRRALTRLVAGSAGGELQIRHKRVSVDPRPDSRLDKSALLHFLGYGNPPARAVFTRAFGV
jgi:hypothetical protein